MVVNDNLSNDETLVKLNERNVIFHSIILVSLWISFEEETIRLIFTQQ